MSRRTTLHFVDQDTLTRLQAVLWDTHREIAVADRASRALLELHDLLTQAEARLKDLLGVQP